MFDNIVVEKEKLTKELKKVFEKLPGIICDFPSLIWIIEKLTKEFKKDFEEQTEEGENNV